MSESEEHISKHRLSLTLFLAIVGILSITVMFFWAQNTAPSATTPMADDPCSLRLRYVRPDYGLQVYDANAIPLGNIPPTYMRNHWEAGKMPCEFAFALRAEEKHVLFSPWVSLPINQGATRQMGYLHTYGMDNTWHQLSVQATLPTQGRQSRVNLWLFSVTRPGEAIRTVDATIRYFAGPRGSALATFKGPFRKNVTYTASENAQSRLIAKLQQGSDLVFQLSGPPPIESETPVIVYKRNGERIFSDSKSGSTSSSRGFKWTMRVKNTLLSNVIYVTIGETPLTQTFRDISVRFPDRPQSTYPAYLEEVNDRLESVINLSNPKSIDHFMRRELSPQQALAILDIALPPLLGNAIQSLKKASIGSLSPAEQSRLHTILTSWMETDRTFQACQLGLWAGWHPSVDHAIDLLQSDTLSLEQFSILAADLSSHVPGETRHLEAAAQRLLTHRLAKRYSYDRLFNLLRRLPEQCHPYLKRLAECDRPWIWERIIRADNNFRQLKQSGLLSATIRSRAYALGLEDWFDYTEKEKNTALDELAAMLTPAYVQQGRVSDWFRHCETLMPPEQGTEVLVRYIQRQLEEWDTWQVPNYASRNPYGIRLAVQLLNKWHNLNLGGLGQDRSKFEHSEYNFIWQEVAQEVLHWRATGHDPSRLPPDWQPQNQDLRIIWYNQQAPERSIIALWPSLSDPNLHPSQSVLVLAQDFLHVSLNWDQPQAAPQHEIQLSIRAGRLSRNSQGGNYTLTPNQLPKQIHPGPTNAHSVRNGIRQEVKLWKGKWEIWIERAWFPQSVLSGTTLFQTWRERYQSAAPHPRDRVFSQSSQQELLNYILARRDFSDMTDVEIALRLAMDQDPTWPNRDLEEFKELMSFSDAIVEYQKLLERPDLPVEAQIFAWFQIAKLSLKQKHNHPDGPLPPLTYAKAYTKASTLDPRWVSATTLNIQLQRSNFEITPGVPFGAMLKSFEWLITRTPTMIEDSIRRPTISRYSDSNQSLISPPKDSEQAKASLLNRLRNEINQQRQIILDLKQHAGNRFNAYREHWDRLESLYQQHWIHEQVETDRSRSRGR